MKKRFSHNPISLKLLAVVFLLLIISSCCKEGDCKCNHDCPKEKIDYTKFFIAHAGGAIDGITHTNSLEALNTSYSKGCRLFELDLQTTKDGKYIAAHSWYEFKTYVNYPGVIDDTPLSEAEVLSFKIHGKYTPLNMDAINLWFKKHPDAILVTDKTNDPEKIFNDFKYRNRVLVELFTWEAVDKAIELGIKPMVSENLIFGWSVKAKEMGIPPQPCPRDSVIEQILEEKKIEYIVTGFYYLQDNDNKIFFKRLKEKGIKCYLGPIRIDAEDYVWIYEMKYCYGMYADNLDLLAFLLQE